MEGGQVDVVSELLRDVVRRYLQVLRCRFVFDVRAERHFLEKSLI